MYDYLILKLTEPKDDHDNMIKQFPVYDALYAFAKADNKDKLLTSRN